jgi:hypothetical protein
MSSTPVNLAHSRHTVGTQYWPNRDFLIARDEEKHDWGGIARAKYRTRVMHPLFVQLGGPVRYQMEWGLHFFICMIHKKSLPVQRGVKW